MTCNMNLDTILLKNFFDRPISTSKISYMLEMGLFQFKPLYSRIHYIFTFSRQINAYDF